MLTVSPFALGATLYLPATRDDILSVAAGNKIQHLKSMVICLEDAVAPTDVSAAFANLKTITQTLARGNKKAELLLFIRPRNLMMAKQIVAELDLTAVDGFVLPKFTQATLPDWFAITKNTHLCWMPTLETAEVFDPLAMQALAEALAAPAIKARILALRIGGNDLMSVLGIRRSREHCLYQGPLGHLIKMLTCIFAAKGFALTSPVFELISNTALLEQEIQQDLLHGLVGKTAIHPSQIDIIQRAWMVEADEYEDALHIMNSTQAVYQHAGAMYEPATHRQWAKNILERRRLFGVKHNVQELQTVKRR